MFAHACKLRSKCIANLGHYDKLRVNLVFVTFQYRSKSLEQIFLCHSLDFLTYKSLTSPDICSIIDFFSGNSDINLTVDLKFRQTYKHI